MKNYFLTMLSVVAVAGASACGPQDETSQQALQSDITTPANPAKLRPSPARVDLTVKRGTGDYAQVDIINTSEDTVVVDSAMLSAVSHFTVTPTVSLPVALAPHGAPLHLYIGLDASYDRAASQTTDTLDITPEHAASLRIPLAGTITE